MSARLIPIRIYQILEEHSDQEHPLSMGELQRLLRVEYGVNCDRRTVYGALDSLRLAGCEIRGPGWLRQQMERIFFAGWSLYRDAGGPEPTGQKREC